MSGAISSAARGQSGMDRLDTPKGPKPASLRRGPGEDHQLCEKVGLSAKVLNLQPPTSFQSKPAQNNVLRWDFFNSNTFRCVDRSGPHMRQLSGAEMQILHQNAYEILSKRRCTRPGVVHQHIAEIGEEMRGVNSAATSTSTTSTTSAATSTT